jgi:hypothetical protein
MARAAINGELCIFLLCFWMLPRFRHHNPLDAYLKAAGIEGDRKEPLFRAAIGKTKKLGQGAISRTDVWYMVRRRTADAGHRNRDRLPTFCATGITDYLTNGGRIEVTQRMAGCWCESKPRVKMEILDQILTYSDIRAFATISALGNQLVAWFIGCPMPAQRIVRW